MRSSFAVILDGVACAVRLTSVRISQSPSLRVEAKMLSGCFIMRTFFSIAILLPLLEAFASYFAGGCGRWLYLLYYSSSVSRSISCDEDSKFAKIRQFAATESERSFICPSDHRL